MSSYGLDDVPSGIHDYATELVSVVMDRERERMFRPRITEGLRAASYWISFRYHGVPRSIDEVASMFGCSHRSVSLGVRRIEREAPRHVGGITTTSASISTMVARFVDMLDLESTARAEDVKIHAKNLVARVDVYDAHFSEQSIVTAAVVKCIVDRYGGSVTTVCRKLNVSHTTTSSVISSIFP